MEQCGDEPPRSELVQPCIVRCDERCSPSLLTAPDPADAPITNDAGSSDEPAPAP